MAVSLAAVHATYRQPSRHSRIETTTALLTTARIASAFLTHHDAVTGTAESHVVDWSHSHMNVLLLIFH